MSLEDFSTKNISESLALYLAGELIKSGYLIYWHETDIVQTSDGADGYLWYPSYSTEQETYAADTTFAASKAAAKGLMTLRGKKSANPRFPSRLPNDGGVAGEDTVTVPALSLALAPMVPLVFHELGNGDLMQRVRGLTIEGIARSGDEQDDLVDLLGKVFKSGLTLTVKNHADGTLDTVGTVDLMRPLAQAITDPDAAEAMTHQVMLNVRVEYVA